MILRIIWLLLGFTAWALDNLEFLYHFYSKNLTCVQGVVSKENFFLLNFAILEVIGAICALITIIVIPIKVLKAYYKQEKEDEQKSPEFEDKDEENKGKIDNEELNSKM